MVLSFIFDLTSLYLAAVKINDLVTSYLLQHHECVLPGIGVFRVTHMPASYDESRHLMLPSAEEIVFRETSAHHAVDLVAFIALKESISHQQADERLNAFCVESKETIKGGGKLVIETFGSLQTNAAGNIYFSRDKVPVFFEPVKAEVIYEDDSPSAIQHSSSGENLYPEQPARSYWWVWAIVLFAVGVAGFVYHFSNHSFSIEDLGNVAK